MVSPDLKTPYMQQWSINGQWEFRNNWLLEVGYIGSKGSNLLQFINQNQALDIAAIGGFLPRPGVPGGGFTGNYYDPDEDEFVNLRDASSRLRSPDDPGECIIAPELRGPLLGLDEDEGANMLVSNGQILVPLAADEPAEAVHAGLHVQRELHVLPIDRLLLGRGAIPSAPRPDAARAEQGAVGLPPKAPADPELGVGSAVPGQPVRRGLADRGHRDVPVGPARSPCSTRTSAASSSARRTRDRTSRLAMTHEDQTTSGSVTDRIDNYLNPDAFVSSVERFGNLGRNTVIGPAQRRVDVSISKMTRL